MLSPRNRILIFVALCFLCAAGVVEFARRPNSRGPAATATTVATIDHSSPRIFFRYTGIDSNYGKLAVADLARLDAPRIIENLPCEVVAFAGGQGICLQANRAVFTTYAAQLFDSDLKPTFRIPLHGGPSRARVSPDGKIAAATIFLSGHSYASLNFSTEALLIETATGKVSATLENDFAVAKDGAAFKANDFNFWGVTFTPDPQHFYCTLSTNQKHYLLLGDISTRTAKVVHENVECPSVSPDGTRVAYKKRFIIDQRLSWQLHVLDLATDRETPLAEKRSIDDQIEWLDNEHVLYAISDNPNGSSATTNVWTAAADGSKQPKLFLAKAYSPSIVR